ncbi:MAG: HD domain-containing protein [Calditrichaeota bacterium]|nr:MAG: HD domain-containing protein [Calditrichota bacterium]
MNPKEIISKYYAPYTEAMEILLTHSEVVAEKAKKVAMRLPELNPDIDFIVQAAWLHDIGIFQTNAPGIGCTGSEPYLCHGVLGRKILEDEGLPLHALVCERHVGTGLSKALIEKQNLPLPRRDMVPVTLEEKIICFADKFFSKNKKRLRQEKSIDRIQKSLQKHGDAVASQFDKWLIEFKETGNNTDSL